MVGSTVISWEQEILKISAKAYDGMGLNSQDVLIYAAQKKSLACLGSQEQTKPAQETKIVKKSFFSFRGMGNGW